MTPEQLAQILFQNTTKTENDLKNQSESIVNRYLEEAMMYLERIETPEMSYPTASDELDSARGLVASHLTSDLQQSQAHALISIAMLLQEMVLQLKPETIQSLSNPIDQFVDNYIINDRQTEKVNS